MTAGQGADGRPAGPAEPGTLGNPIELTDPRAMRALAHQGRIAIWSYLGLHGPATATECAEIAGLSPSACSYHLRTDASGHGGPACSPSTCLRARTCRPPPSWPGGC